MQLQYSHVAISQHYHYIAHAFYHSVSVLGQSPSRLLRSLLLYFQLNVKFASDFFLFSKTVYSIRHRFSLKQSLLLRGYILMAYCSYYLLYLYHYPGKRQESPRLHWLKSQRPHWHKGSLTQHRTGPCSQLLLWHRLGNKIGKKNRRKTADLK